MNGKEGDGVQYPHLQSQTAPSRALGLRARRSMPCLLPRSKADSAG